MSGHSKWANIKHRKAAQDAKKGVAYQKLTKNVIAAAKAGGGDPNNNFRLKVAIERARAGNVPVDNIERAVKKGTGELGGAIGELGCVAWNFERRGVVEVIGSGIDADALLNVAIESGADDMVTDEESFTILCEPSSLSEVGESVRQAGYPIERMEIEMIPKNTVDVTSKTDAAKLLAMIDRFEEHDDVQNVYANFEIPEEILSQLE